MSKATNESWEIVVGGNFLQVWEKGRHVNCKYLDYESGKVCDIALPNTYETGINSDKAIKTVTPRARLIARAPSMLALLEKVLPIIENEAGLREFSMSQHGEDKCVTP